MIADKEHLAMASVPVQTWGALYDKDEVLAAGTVFKELDMPFFAADHIPAEKGVTDPLTEIQKISFILDDLRLYLDTHPDDHRSRGAGTAEIPAGKGNRPFPALRRGARADKREDGCKKLLLYQSRI
ncbi:MAG TPA: spore coat associated protein CotJA [Candidatus Mediterraneibacter quadrami]|uniref:Spore coat associated protein CotJA n=1 Tax=Candidatus Mediterraneibacter quadrami TaxID=2838684 RepID=A0A9D2U6J0_9FIRM|nr:spore coat associated protein CotJA [Candidatus Mediterraneibacter quadrami]